MPAQLEIYNESGVVKRVSLDQREMVIGRSPTSEIHLKAPTISRRHAQLSRDSTGWTIKDLGSRGGVLVNGERIEERPIRLGDVIQISGFMFRLLDGLSENQAPPKYPTMWTHESTSPQISILSQGEPPKIGLSHIAALNSFGQAQQKDPDRGGRLRTLCSVVAGGVLDGQWALALELSHANPGRPPRILASWPEDLLQTRDVHISRTTISAMRDSASPVLASNFSQTPDLVEMSIIEGAPQTAVAACPLDSDADHTRLLYVTLPPRIATTEWLAVISLAGKAYEQAEAVWREKQAIEQYAALQRDLNNARSIQTSILPENRSIDGFDIAWSFEPCDLVGGDFIDLVTLPDGRLMVAIADVSGHGLASALTTLSIHSVLQTCIRSGMDIQRMMSMLNEHLCIYLPMGRFVTMLVVLIDPRTGQTQCISAGHHPPVIVAPCGSTRELKHGSDLIMGVQACLMPSASDQLQPGETMLLYTDGLIEMPHPQGGMLRTEGLCELFAGLHAEGSTASGLTESLRTELNTLQGDQPILDDQSFMVVRRTES